VLGTQNYHNNTKPLTTGSGNCSTSIYQIGWSSSACRTGSVDDPCEKHNAPLGNYDVYTRPCSGTLRKYDRRVLLSTATLCRPLTVYELVLSHNKTDLVARCWPAMAGCYRGQGLAGLLTRFPLRPAQQTSAKMAAILIFDANACYYSQQRPAPPTILRSLSLIFPLAGATLLDWISEVVTSLGQQ